ncbi:MAG: fibronectin type III domain-containing protein [Acidimicrobiales bacterium]
MTLLVGGLVLAPAGWAGASTTRHGGSSPRSTVPIAPGKPRVTPGDHSVKVNWTAPTDGGSPITAYTARSTPTGKTCTTTGATVCTVTTLENGTVYRFSVSAHNTSGTSLQSLKSTPVTPATIPSPPPAASADRSDGVVTITWAAPTDGGSPISEYDVYRGISPGAEGRTPIATVGATRFAFTDTSVVPGPTYYYEIAAVNAAGVSEPSAQVSARLLAASSGGDHMAATPTNAGYWIVSADGGVFSYRAARFEGSLPGLGVSVNDVVGIAATPSGHGYWLVGADGGIFSFGDARFYGSMGGKPLNQPIVGMAAMPTGAGYWEVASDGGIFSFGAARFHGSMGGKPLNQPIVGMAATPTGAGYWEVASDGGIFSFGDARFHGSTGSIRLNQPIVAMTAMSTARGYWLVSADGGIFAFTAPFFGSTGSKPPSSPVDGLVATLVGRVYTVVDAAGAAIRFEG